MKMVIPYSAGMLLAMNSLISVSCPIEKSRYKYSNSATRGVAKFTPSYDQEGDSLNGLTFDLDFATQAGTGGARSGGHFSVRYMLSNSTGQRIDAMFQEQAERRPLPQFGRDANEISLDLVRRIFVWNSDHKLMAKLPMIGEEGPEFVFVPDLYTAFRYIDGVSVGKGMFELTSCAE